MNKKKKVLIGISILIIVLIIVVAFLFCYVWNQKDVVEENIDNNLDKINVIENEMDQKNKDIIIKVLDDIEKNTDFTNILKSTTGDITAEKLSQKEFIDSKSDYIAKLQNNMNIFNIYEENGIKYVEYEVEKVLNTLGYSSHMGVGIKQGVQIVNVSGTSDISNRGIIIKVLDDIEKNTDFTNILKSTTGDITAEKLSQREFIDSKYDYIEKLQNNMNIFNIYEENGIKYVEYEVEKVLNTLGYSSHMGVGIKQGVQIVNVSGTSDISNRGIIIKVLDDIEKNTDFTNILKSTTGDITAEKLSQREFIDSKSDYIAKLQNNMNIFNIYEEKGIKYVEYEVEKVLNTLGYSSHMGVGIKQGIQTITI